MLDTGHTNTRFAVYLIPPYQVAQAVAEIHRMLRKQFGLIAASRFPVHATIKGFFKLPRSSLRFPETGTRAKENSHSIKITSPCSESPFPGNGLRLRRQSEHVLEPLVERLDAVFAVQRPFPVHFCGLCRDPLGVSLDISCLGEVPNPKMMALRQRVVEAVQPFVAADCDFSGEDLDQPFAAHITLAFRDFVPGIQEEVLAYLQDVPLPCEPFMADTLHFLAFHSQAWAGAWHKTLTWQLLKTWRVF